MSKNLSFVKNQLIDQFLQPKKMSKNLSSGFTAFKISQVPKTLGFSHNEKNFSPHCNIFLISSVQIV